MPSKGKGEPEVRHVKADKKLAAACGLFCPACNVFIGTHEDPERLKASAQRMGRSVEELRCDGCGSERRCFYCQSCTIIRCVKGKGIDFCGECNEYPCVELKAFQAERPHRIELWKNLESIRADGYEKWFSQMIARYSCPQCHTINSAYDPVCRTCGAEPSCAFVVDHGKTIQNHMIKMNVPQK